LITTTEATTLAATYFQAWKAKDFATLRSVLADEATFHGPLGTAHSAAECLAGLRQMTQILADIIIQKVSPTVPMCSPGSIYTPPLHRPLRPRTEPHRGREDRRDRGHLRPTRDPRRPLTVLADSRVRPTRLARSPAARHARVAARRRD
jgi:SnoaL-like domain